MMRSLLAAGAATALALTLTACGSGEDEPADADGGTSSQETDAGGGSESSPTQEAAEPDDAAEALDAAERFFAALAEDDYEALCELLETPEYDSVEACVADTQDDGGSSEERRAQVRSMEITGVPQVTGDTAVIPTEQLTFERDGQRVNAVNPTTLRKDAERGWVVVIPE